MDESADKVAVEGVDNGGRPRQDYADTLAGMDEEAFTAEAERAIWHSSYAMGNPRSDYHWKVQTCYAEALRRGAPQLYQAAYRNAAQ